MSSAELTDMIWGDDAPERVAGSIRTYVWSLRRNAALAHRLIRDDYGYLLKIGTGELDYVDFRVLTRDGIAALDRGDARRAAEKLRAATTLWREPQLADFPPTARMSAAVTRLRAERLSAQDYLIDARLALGQHRELLGELRTRVADNPDHERSWTQLLLVLYRSGLRAEALRMFLRASRLLAGTHGIEPGPELRRLHDQILHDDPALAVHGRLATVSTV